MPTVPYVFTSAQIAKSADVNTNFQTLANAILPTFAFTVAGTLVVSTSVTPALIVHNSLTISKVYAYVKTAPTGANIIIDIHLNGISIWNATQANRLTIVAGAQTATQTSFNSVNLSEGDILTIDVDQIGSTVAGSDLTIELKCT